MSPTTCKSCGLPIFHGPAGYAGPQCMCRWTSAAPRQPEGEGLEVVGWYHLHAEVATSDKVRVAEWLPECVEPLCRLSDAQRAIAELREELDAAKEILAQQGRRNTELRAERDTLRQQLAEARDEITQHSYDLTLVYMKGGADMRQQRDKMVGLLMEADASFVDGSEAGLELSDRIHSALSEVSK